MKITVKGLEQLKVYKYTSAPYTKLDYFLNDHLWIPLVEYVPKWVAPNLITFTGFLGIITATVVLMLYDILGQTIPTWALLLQSASIFVYQTLDAIDGKQARRTNSSSPLGQLFDHGCDAIVTIFFLIGVAVAAGVDATPLFLCFCGLGLVLFAANSYERHTGIMHTQVNNFGVTEAHYLCIAVNIITVVFGRDLWQKACFGVKVWELIALVFVPANMLLGIFVLCILFRNGKNRQEIIRECGTMILFLAVCSLWTRTTVLQSFPTAVVLHFGFLLSLMICKLIICSTTKDRFPGVHYELVPFLVLSLLVMLVEGYPWLQFALFCFSFTWNAIAAVYLLTHSVSQIKQYLGIYCFSLAKPQ